MLDDFEQWEQYRYGINFKQFMKIISTELSLIVASAIIVLMFLAGTTLAFLTSTGWETAVIIFSFMVLSAMFTGFMYAFVVARRDTVLALLAYAKSNK